MLARFGHVRDLPPKDGSVDPEQGFAMQWQVSPDRAKQLKAIADEAKNADTLILATDPDREGEAISWHVQEVLRQKKALPANVQRVTFNAITNSAVTEAMKHPRGLDEDLIDAYRARRALDYLVGFTLSPILWRKLPGAKSAGRVQSVALRLIVDREREIEVFKAAGILVGQRDASRRTGRASPARLVQLDGKKIDRLTIGNKGDADAAKAVVEAGRFTVSSVETKPFAQNPPPPFTTSTLQQEAARKLGFCRQPHDAGRPGALRGRADHLHADRRRRHGARGDQRRPPGDRRAATTPATCPTSRANIKSKIKNAQEAHEAIRPTDFDQRARRLGRPCAALRAGLQPRAGEPDGVGAARADDGRADRRRGPGGAARDRPGRALPRLLALYDEGRDEKPRTRKARACRRCARAMRRPRPASRRRSSFTQPPPRYSEASLVKRLEELGIGRPSTYASTCRR